MLIACREKDFRDWNFVMDNLNFREWVDFESDRIVRMGLQASEDHRADYMIAQIQAALMKAFLHGADGLSDVDPPRPTAR